MLIVAQAVLLGHIDLLIEHQSIRVDQKKWQA
jgi:hypothetical protein